MTETWWVQHNLTIHYTLKCSIIAKMQTVQVRIYTFGLIQSNLYSTLNLARCKCSAFSAMYDLPQFLINLSIHRNWPEPWRKVRKVFSDFFSITQTHFSFNSFYFKDIQPSDGGAMFFILCYWILNQYLAGLPTIPLSSNFLVCSSYQKCLSS